MFLIYAIPGLFNPSLNIILTHFWDEIILWEAVEIIVEITPMSLQAFQAAGDLSFLILYNPRQ